MRAKSIKAEILNGPFDPGGQPDSRTGQPLELSLFAWNVQGGLSPNKAVLTDPARYRDYWHWDIASGLLRDAERLGFDHQVQYGLWSGYGGPSGWNDAALDFATAAAAAAAITDRINHFSTVHVGYRFHPMHIAKIGADIDFISKGRWGLNIVAGQNPEDFRKFGFKEIPSGEERYAIADEFVTLMKYLWSSEVPVDFEGKYFQSYGGSIAPRPISKPRPILLNAGQSGPGFDFACRQADWVFVAPPTARIEDYAELANRAHALAAKYGRRIRVAAMCYCVIEATDAEAQRTVQWLESEVDREAVRNYLETAIGTSSELTYDLDDPFVGLGREQFMKVALGMTGFQLFGGPETIAETMRALHAVGVENIVTCFWDPKHGVEIMGNRVIPLLKKMNLRR